MQIAKATITSPIDGVVVNRNINPGEYPGNREIFTLQQVDPIYAVLHASSEQVAAHRQRRGGDASARRRSDRHRSALRATSSACSTRSIPARPISGEGAACESAAAPAPGNGRAGQRSPAFPVRGVRVPVSGLYRRQSRRGDGRQPDDTRQDGKGRGTRKRRNDVGRRRRRRGHADRQQRPDEPRRRRKGLVPA